MFGASASGTGDGGVPTDGGNSTLENLGLDFDNISDDEGSGSEAPDDKKNPEAGVEIDFSKDAPPTEDPLKTAPEGSEITLGFPDASGGPSKVSGEKKQRHRHHRKHSQRNF